MRSAVEAAGDQSIPPSSSSLRWSSPLPSSLPPPPPSIHSTLKSPSPMEVQESRETQDSQSEHGTTGMEPGPSSTSPYDSAQKSPPRDLNDVSMGPAESSRGTPNDLSNEGDDAQPSTSRSHSHFVENSNPSKLLRPKLEPLDEESSRDGFTPIDSLAHIKTESGMGRFSEMRSEDSRSEVSNVEAKRYRVSFKVCSKAAARLKRILNSQPMALKKLGIAGVQVDQSGGMISVASRAKERAAEEATRRPDLPHSGSVPTPAVPSQPQMRVVDRNGDVGGMMVAGGINTPQPGYSSQPTPSQCHPVMHPGHMGAPVGQVNIQHSQMGDGPSGSGGVPMGAMPPSALPPHMQQQRQAQPPPTNSPILVNLLNSQPPPPAVGGRPFSPYTPGYSGGPPGGSGSAPPSAQPQPGQAMDQSMAAYHHHQMQERQRMMIQQQQQMQQQGAATPTTPGSGPGPSGYGYPQRPMYPGPQPGMYPQGHPNSQQQRVPYPGQPAMYPAMPQVKQEPGTAGYGMPQVKQEPVETAPPPPKKRKKPTKKQQKEAEAAAAAQAQAAAAQPGPFFSDGRMMHPQQMQGGFPGGAAHPQYPPGTGPPQSGMPAQYYQQQPTQQQMFMQQQMQHRMMQQQQQQQQQMGMAPEYPSGTHAAPPSGPSAPWHPHQRPPPVPYPPGQNDGSSAGVSGATGTGEMTSHSDSNSPVTPFGTHSIMVQQQQQSQQSGHSSHASPMYGRESGGGTPTLFPYPSTSHGGPGPSGQSGLNSTPLTPGTTPQTPGGHQQSLPNENHDFDVKLLGEGTLDDLGDLDDIVPMGDLMMGGSDGGQAGGEGTVKEEVEEENGDGGGGTTSPIKKNGKHDLDMSINSVVDMVAKGGGELSSPTPPSTATPTGGGNGASAFPVTTPASNTSTTAPPTPTLQTPVTPTIRRKNTASSVQQLTAHQRMQQQQMMGGGGQYGSHFGMPPGGMAPQGGMGPMHNHPSAHSMGHGPPLGLHLPQQQTPHLPPGHSMEQYSRALPPSYNHPSRGGRAGGAAENGRINGHPEMSNGSRDDREDRMEDPSIQALLNKVKGLKQTEALQKEQQRTNSGGGRGGRGGGAGSRKKRPAKEIAKERSPKEEDEAFLLGMEGLRGSTMTAGQAAKARMGVGQGGGGMPPGASSYYHPISAQNHPMRPQPPPVQNKPT